MKTSICIQLFIPVIAFAMVATAGCVAEAGVEGDGGGVYYGPGYDDGPWFHDGVWVHGRRWDNQRGEHEVHAPPRGSSGPHLPNRSRPAASPGGGGHISASPRSPGSDHH